ncbi:MAG TPA: hypothetical protein VGJ91_23185, partial [Polyangiaceae bacterium]
MLLCGCQRHSGGPARVPPPARPAHVAARLGTHIPSRSGNERLSFDARIDASLKRIEIEICPSGFRIERLNAPSPDAQRLLERGVIITPEGEYPCPGEGLDLPQAKADQCLHYAVNLPEKSSDPTSLRRTGADALLSPDLWLWVPSPRPLGVAMQVRFTLPDGLVALVPWNAALPETAFAWKSAGAFSHAPPTPLLAQD